MIEQQKQLAAIFADVLPREMSLSTSLEGLHLFRIDHSFARSPYSYNSEIIILGQGEKRVYLGSDVYAYDPAHYLVLPVPLPAECEGSASPEKPILGFSLAIDPVEIGELLLEMDGDPKESSLQRGIYAAPMNEGLCDASIRLLKAVTDPEDKKVLAPMIKREILYRILRGEKGEILQAVAHRNRRFFQIARVLRQIHESYPGHFNIEKLARELDMSTSTFHSSFKAVTDTSPLQYIKNVRLHKARTLMIERGVNASTAAVEVGYESPSQFNREYKRLFGRTPAKDASSAGA